MERKGRSKSNKVSVSKERVGLTSPLPTPRGPQAAASPDPSPPLEDPRLLRERWTSDPAKAQLGAPLGPAPLPPTPADVAEAVRKYLDARGVSPEVAAHAGLLPLTPEETAEHGGVPVPSLKIPYFDAQGQPTGFYRLRYLADVIDTRTGKVQKFSQPKGSLPTVYFPKVKSVEWSPLVTDPRVSLVITEGEIKALAATAAGIPTAGLGGVDSWQARRRGISLLPELAAVKWSGREVAILYDSDAETKRDVIRARTGLARALADLEANVKIARLPLGADGAKVGLDDFLVQHGVEELDRLLDGAEPWKMTDLLYVLPLQRFLWRRADDRFDPNTPLVDAAVRRALLDAGYSAAQAKAVLSNPSAHLFCHDIDCMPGAPEIFDRGGQRVLNTYFPPEIQPAKGAWPTVETVLQNLCNHSQAARVYVFNWIAAKVQDPLLRPGIALVFWGANGTGKTLLGFVVRTLLGLRNCGVLEQSDLDSQFNAGLAGKLLAVGNEIALPRSRREASARLKALVTDDSLRIEGKGTNALLVPNRLAWILTGNDIPTVVESTDRRYSVFHQGMPPTEEFKAACKSLFLGHDTLSEKGRAEVAAFLWDLLDHKVDAIAACNPFQNEDRREAMEATRAVVENFAAECVAVGLRALGLPDDAWKGWTPVGRRPRVPIEAIYAIYCQWCAAQGAGEPKALRAFGVAFRDALQKVARLDLVRERVHRPGQWDERKWCYVGLPLDPSEEASAAA